ncbi:MAG: hypothetical protein AABZ55_12275 [Bdellovibrionota bacterium]
MEYSKNVLKPILRLILGHLILPSAIFAVPVLVLATPASPCQLEASKPHFLATFELKAGAEKSQQMVFCVSKPGTEIDKTPIEAEIWSDRGREAICKHTYFERDGLSPLSMILDCRSTRLLPLNTPVTLYWPSGEINGAVLRFGTWLNGYTQTLLRIKIDHFTQNIKIASGR